MKIEQAEFEGLTGVGKVQLTLDPDQHVYTFIGVNGVGKTKTLEALFQLGFFTHSAVTGSGEIPPAVQLQFSQFRQTGSAAFTLTGDNVVRPTFATDPVFNRVTHSLPIVFLGGQTRGMIKSNLQQIVSPIGKLENRRNQYFSQIISNMQSEFGSLNMDKTVESWFVALAQSTNPYQKGEDNRGVEIETVINILNQIDSRIDPDYLEISGAGRVSLKIEGVKRELSQLSSGFTSIVKLVQAIVSGYGYFTNETHLQQVKGIVLIDEIESHLHLTWQVNIIPLLKRLFPNTVFYITTHSSVVISQLHEGEAYRLYRDVDGIVKTGKIASPNKAAFADLLKDVFQLDINMLKIDSSDPQKQMSARKSLLNLIDRQGRDNE